MNLKCPACGAPFSADDVHVDLGVANCRVCRGVLDLRAADRPLDAPVPPRFTVDESDGVAISWRWWTTSSIGLVLFCGGWWTFLVVWYRGALHGNDVMAIVFPIFHVGAGVFMGYRALTSIFNRTRIGVDLSGGLFVEHSPLPWPKPPRLRRDELQQLFVQRVESKNSVTFTLAAVEVGGKRRKLVNALSLDDARFLEHRLERQLGIKDVPVEGEARR